MNKFWMCFLLVCAALAFASCGGTAPVANNTTNANSNTNAAKPVAAAPTKESLAALEKSAFEAWKNKDGKFFEGFMADGFVSFGQTGRTDKAGSIKEITESKCQVNSFGLADEQMTAAGPDVAILTSKATADYTCDGKKQPGTTWASTIFVRSGDAWKAAYHNEAVAADPNAKSESPKPAAVVEKIDDVSETKADALTESLLAVEKKSWEAWKTQDAKPLEQELSKDFVAVSSTGRTDKAATIKEWTESKCDVKSYSLTDAKSVSLNATTALLTFRGNAEGTCGGEPLSNLWGTTLFIKEGDAWKPVFYMSTM
ncbi:MAG TPA: nuclear transport factor 2 family protein [Pyrinomonadaceae bacterium]|nr:nuclear transport factor 2 family protein [Pyrinomonadaceae bacterium]